MIVCVCRGVSDRTVRLAVVKGASSMAEIGKRCGGAGTDCGSCRHAIEDILDEAAVVTAPMGCESFSESGRSESGRTESPTP